MRLRWNSTVRCWKFEAVAVLYYLLYRFLTCCLALSVFTDSKSTVLEYCNLLLFLTTWTNRSKIEKREIQI